MLSNTLVFPWAFRPPMTTRLPSGVISTALILLMFSAVSLVIFISVPLSLVLYFKKISGNKGRLLNQLKCSSNDRKIEGGHSRERRTTSRVVMFSPIINILEQGVIFFPFDYQMPITPFSKIHWQWHGLL